jgi:Domain of unknown function (DUF4430)
MGRVTLTKQLKLTIAALVLVIGIGGGTYYAMSPNRDIHTVTNAQHQLTQISYPGQTGIDALTLLKKHATVQTKHYSFGDIVTAINGATGSGPKYWTFYINGKEAQVGAGAYTTKQGDTLKWVLQ